MGIAAENIRAKGEEIRQRAAARRDQARKDTPAEYHGYIIDLEQKVRLAGFEVNELKNVPGFAVYGGKTFAEVAFPYVAVDGRIRMAIDEHRKADKKLVVSFATEWARNVMGFARASGLSDEVVKQIPSDLKDILTATVMSDIYGTFEGSAKIARDGEGVDKTNPYENAQTSALGRALGNMGYGLLGGGVASYEEVRAAIEERERTDTKAPTPPAAAPAPSPKPAPAPTPTPVENGPTPPQPVTNPQSTPADNAGDSALTQDVGACADCGAPIDENDAKQKAIAQFIRSRRKAGDKVRWTHAAVKGGDKFCAKPAEAAAS